MLKKAISYPSSLSLPSLKAIEGIGPEAAAATPHIVRNWQGEFACYSYWINPLAAIGPGAMEAVPMLEQFRKKAMGDDGQAVGYRAAHSLQAEALYALCRIRRSPEDLRELVAVIGGAGGGPKDPAAALAFLEKLGKDAAPALPEIRELMAAGNITDEWKARLAGLLAAMPAQ